MKSVVEKAAVEQRNSERVAIIGATIIDGNGGAPIDNGVILVEGKRIVAVGDHSVSIPPQAKQIRASGKFIIPGLMYTHVYLVDGTWVPEMIRYEGRYDEVAIEGAQLALKGGVTTVFDCWGPRDPLIKARNAINEGRAVGARIYLCGNWIGCGGPFSIDNRPQFRRPVGEPFATRIDALFEANVGGQLASMPLEEVRQEVRTYLQSGIDYVTYIGNCKRADSFQFLVFSPRVQRMIVEEAHRAGLPVYVYFAATEESVRLAAEASVDAINAIPWARTRIMSAETLKLLLERNVAVHSFFISTDKGLEFYKQTPLEHLPGGKGFREIIHAQDLDNQALIRAGVPLLMKGNGAVGLYSPDQRKDWGFIYPPGEGYVEIGEGHVGALETLQQKGMTAMSALMTVTRNVARAFKVDKDLGTLERGKLADLVILDKNPLENAQNYRGIHLVMKEGQVIDRDALPTQRLWSAPSFASEAG